MTSGAGVVYAHGWRRDLKDVGDQALMRGLLPHSRVCVRGCPDLTAGVGSRTGHKASDGRSPAVVPPPPVREGLVRRSAVRQAARASRATDHMKPTSSRAIAVQTTVVFLPRPLSAR